MGIEPGLNFISKATKQYIKYRLHAPAKVSDSFEGSTALAAPLRCIFSRTHLFYSHLRRRRKITSSQVSAGIYRLLTAGNWKIPRLFHRQTVSYYWGETRPPTERSVGRMLPVVFPGESFCSTVTRVWVDVTARFLPAESERGLEHTWFGARPVGFDPAEWSQDVVNHRWRTVKAKLISSNNSGQRTPFRPEHRNRRYFYFLFLSSMGGCMLWFVY